MSNFVHLHNHTMYSTLDGFGKPHLYANAARSRGHSHLAITDHGNIDGAIKFQEACKTAGVIPIFGCEFYIVKDINIKEKGEKKCHVTVLARNEHGWNNILKMVSISNLQGFYYKPRISPEVLIDHIFGTIIMTGCSLSFLNEDSWGIDLFWKLKELYSEDTYLEVMPHNFQEQNVLNMLCKGLSASQGMKLVATNDCHYVEKSDAINQEVLLAIQTKKKWKDPDRWKFNGKGFYMRTRKEMTECFKEQEALGLDQIREAIRNTMDIAEKCSGFQEIPKQKINLPVIKRFEKDGAKKTIERLCKAGFFEKIEMRGKDVNLYKERLDMELEIIFQKNYARYFLIVWDLVLWCKNRNIFVGPGRGSSSGSLVCYLLGITKVDPIEHDLIFARFISPDRQDLPDIDIDFEDIKRHRVRKYLEKMYGSWNVAGVSTFSIMQGKSAIRDVSRVFDVPLSDVNKACSTIIPGNNESKYDTVIEEAFHTFEDGIYFMKKYPKVARIAIDLEGTVRQRGQHAAAIIIANEDLRETAKSAYVLGKDKEPIINWDKEDAEYNGLMKLDVLGLNMLSVLNKTRKLVKTHKGKDLDFNQLTLDNKKCFEEFSKGNTIGCFQLGSPGLRKFVQQLGIDNFKMLTHANALYRPGTLRSGTADLFIQRKKGEEKVPKQHPIIEDITKDTFGIILYQEQMMRIVHELAGLDWKIVEKLRKIVGKSKGQDAFMSYLDMFAEGCEEKGTIQRSEAVILWKTLATFGEYCLTGDTKIYRASANQNKKREMTIKEAYEYQKSDNFKKRKLKILSMHDDDLVRTNTINKITSSGRQKVYQIRTLSNKTIKATKNHKFLVENKWRKLSEIKVGNYIRTTELKQRKPFVPTGHGSGYSEICPRFKKGKGKTNDLKNETENLVIDYRGTCQECGKPWKDIHHIDGNNENNLRNNLMILCRSCHKLQHKNKKKVFGKGFYTQNEKIIEIKEVGERDTYDIEMVDEPRNFIANNFVSHNSFNLSHAVAYSIISYWDMYCKVFYPAEFICALLTHGSSDEDKKNEYIEEAFRLKIDVRPPKVGISDPTNWLIKDDVLYAPFIEIKGVGDKTAYAFSSMSKEGGFFVKEGERTPPQKFLKILEELNAYEDVPINDDIADKIDEYLGVSMVKDKLYRYRKLVSLLKDSAELSEIGSISLEKTNRNNELFLGEITDLKLEYYKGDRGVKGGATASIRDSSGYFKFSFNSILYERKKDLIEHCEDEIVIIKANSPKRAGSMVANDAWFLPEIISGELQGLDLDLIKGSRWRNRTLLQCQDCSLIRECDKPVMPSTGKYNVMILGEAPGRDENKFGKGFIGQSGEILWELVEKYGFQRRNFNVSNIVKCWPSKSKTPTRKHIDKCRKWIHEELKQIRPFAVLALGNTNVKYFTDKDSGIMSLSGETEWNEEYGTWICWCIHPASTIYQKENKELFRKGVKNFCETVRNLGFNDY